ncbi:hypothetical protein [Candidatus Formimonas warabiya]|uniref:Uncharacterized protein n=1 Tax=Formimonas warabiya TaxID=1761012 RepID=A0A3G1KNW7_FORW1|nr:hypothetical protein [Candidatus Formimonas warabiya]ATW24158.1 hypothetical protein DCMF_04610 [Candidatus Formimonas warabiya]
MPVKNIDKALAEITALLEGSKIELPEALIEVMSFDKLEQKIRDLIDPRDSNGNRTWRYSIRDTYPGFAVVKDTEADKIYRVDYTVDANDNVTIGQWQEAEYVLQIKPGGSIGPAPSVTVVTESASVQEIDFSELTPIVEAQANGEGMAFRVTVLKPGWNVGLNGRPGDKYYTREACGTLVSLLAGAKAYADHPTRAEDNLRPERSIRDLVGWYSDPRQETDGRTTAIFNLFESAVWLKDILKVIASGKAPKNLAGISINGFGSTKIGAAEGRAGKIVESIKILRSADVVTEASAGGEFEQLVASARNLEKGEDIVDWSKITLDEIRQNRPDLVQTIGQERLTEAKTDFQKDLEAIRESVTVVSGENKKLRDELAAERIKVSIKGKITDLLRESKLPEISQKRLATVLETRDYTKEGVLDETALKEAVTAAVTEEREYLTKLTESGRVVGMGAGGDQGTPGDRLQEVQNKFDNMFGVAMPTEQK